MGNREYKQFYKTCKNENERIITLTKETLEKEYVEISNNIKKENSKNYSNIFETS